MTPERFLVEAFYVGMSSFIIVVCSLYIRQVLRNSAAAATVLLTVSVYLGGGGLLANSCPDNWLKSQYLV